MSLQFCRSCSLVGRLVVKKLTGELEITLLEKMAASEPFAEISSAIGATFDQRSGSTMVRTNKPVIEELRAMVPAWSMDKMVRWEFEKVERWLEWYHPCSHFWTHARLDTRDGG